MCAVSFAVAVGAATATRGCAGVAVAASATRSSRASSAPTLGRRNMGGPRWEGLEWKAGVGPGCHRNGPPDPRQNAPLGRFHPKLGDRTGGCIGWRLVPKLRRARQKLPAGFHPRVLGGTPLARPAERSRRAKVHVSTKYVVQVQGHVGEGHGRYRTRG